MNKKEELLSFIENKFTSLDLDEIFIEMPQVCHHLNISFEEISDLLTSLDQSEEIIIVGEPTSTYYKYKISKGLNYPFPKESNIKDDSAIFSENFTKLTITIELTKEQAKTIEKYFPYHDFVSLETKVESDTRLRDKFQSKPGLFPALFESKKGKYRLNRSLFKILKK